MADIVLVHGIGQEQYGADRLEAEWIPDLASGVRATHRPGAHAVADELTRSIPHTGSGLDVRMAFYGDLFVDHGVQGISDDLSTLNDHQFLLADLLAKEWLGQAASRPGHADNDRARMLLASLEPTAEDQGVHHRAGGAAVRAASKIPWLAYLGMAFAQSCVNRSLRQLTLYLTDQTIRSEAQERIHACVGPETKVIIGHSLGSVVAYEYLHAHPAFDMALLMTLGSPLGMRSVVYEQLAFQTYPNNVRRWVNIADRDDIIAATPDLLRGFGEGAAGRLQSTLTVDNGAKPHEARFYLTKAQAGAALLDSLESRIER